MRILHVLAQLPDRTGSGIYYRNIIDRLAPYGYVQGAVYACQDGDSFDLLPMERRYPVAFKTAALPFPVAGMSDVMPYESTVYSRMDEEMLGAWSDAFRRQLERAQREFRPQVVVLHHLWMLTSLGAEVFDSAVKIGVCHNTDLRQAVKNPSMKERYVTNIERLDAILALSEYQREPIATLYGCDPDRVIVIGGGYDETRFFPADSRVERDRVRLVFAGKIHRSKGVLELVEAFHRLKVTRPTIQLDIIGTPNEEYAGLLEAAIGGEPDIQLLDAMPQQALAEYIRQRDIFVMPSFYEGLGLMAVEALASGLLTVTTEIGGLMELLGVEVGESGAVLFVGLPRLYDADKPFEEDIAPFVDELVCALDMQVDKVVRGEPFPAHVLSLIQKHSWRGIAEKIHRVIAMLME